MVTEEIVVETKLNVTSKPKLKVIQVFSNKVNYGPLK